jgi:hypothetical protein
VPDGRAHAFGQLAACRFKSLVRSLVLIVGFLCLFQAIFIGLSCAAYSFNSVVFGLGFFGGNHG